MEENRLKVEIDRKYVNQDPREILPKLTLVFRAIVDRGTLHASFFQLFLISYYHWSNALRTFTYRSA
jgi:hypothetical protein